MPIKAILPGLVLLVALLAASRGGQAAADELRPVRDWRLVPLAVTSDPDSGLLEALQAQRDGHIEARAKAVRIAVRLPPVESGVLFTFDPSAPSWRYRAEVSEDSTDSADGTWVECAAGEHVRQRGYRLWKVELPAAPNERWLRVAISADEPLAVGSIGLYSLDPGGRNDYWVVLGASIQAQTIRNDVFKQMVAEQYGYDPVIFNTAVGGWQTKDVREALPRILDEHPHARFAVIHIGGNNVSLNRPYPGGATEIREDLVAILQAIAAAGKVPILSRLSYRAYKWDPLVPPEENGSGPYVTAIYDPLIREYCPLFFDEDAGRGVVDAYGWFRSHPQELADDGIHVNEAGETSWNRLWAEHAGKVVYTASDIPAGTASGAEQLGKDVTRMLRLESDVLQVEIDGTTGQWALLDKRSGQRWPSQGTASAGEVPALEGGFVRAEVDEGRAVRLLTKDDAAVVFELADGGRALEIGYESVGQEAIRVLHDFSRITAAESGYAIVPVREGLLIPVEGSKSFRRVFGTSEYEGCHMNMLGLLKAGSGLIIAWDDAYVFPAVERDVSGEEADGAALITSLELRRSARSLRLVPAGRGDWNRIAAVYRRLAEDKGLAVTLQEKIAREPRAGLLVGASNFKLWQTFVRRMNEESTEVEQEWVQWTFDEAAKIAEHLHDDLEIDRCLFTIGGWINGGYDVRHPDILPANPECGGNEALADALKRIDALGYVSCLHDNYQDMYRNAESYDPAYIQKKEDGSLVRGGRWLGGVPDLVCAPKQLELAQRPQNLPEVHKLFPPGCYFIDTTFAVGPQECDDPAHPLSRNDDIAWKARLADYARELFGLFGSECGREWALPHSEVFEGITGVGGRDFHGWGAEDLSATVIPFWEMVYHDCQICHGKYPCPPEQADRSIAAHVLYARPFYYHLGGGQPPHLYWEHSGTSEDEGDAPRSHGYTAEVCRFARSDWGWAEGMDGLDAFIKNTQEVLAPLHRTTAHERLTDFEFLTDDRSMRKAVYGEGEGQTTVVVNYGPEDGEFSSELGGQAILPQWGFVIESPSFAAFYARRWNGVDYEDGALFTIRSDDGGPLREAKRVRIFHGFGPPEIRWNGRQYQVKREETIEVN